VTGDGNVDIRGKGLQNRVLAKVILPREVTHRSERKRTRECRRALPVPAPADFVAAGHEARWQAEAGEQAC
jgi:hypothetical protein